MKKLIYSILTAIVFAGIMPIHATDFYMIGTNVNGQSWEKAMPDAKFTDLGDGTYEWKGEVLSTGFKINDGTWDYAEYNIGSNGSMLILNEPYYFTTGDLTANIDFSGDFTTLKNPTVILDFNNMYITVDGEPSGFRGWHVAGLDSNWSLDDTTVLYETETPGVYSRIFRITQETGEFKISNDGWVKQFGSDYLKYEYISNDHPETNLTMGDGSVSNVPYDLFKGDYLVVFDLNNKMVSFTLVDADLSARYYVGDGRGLLYAAQDDGSGVYECKGYYYEGGMFVIKETYDSATSNFISEYFAAPEGSTLAPDENLTFEKVENVDYLPVTPFDGFQLLVGPTVFFNSTDNSLYISGGNKYSKGEYEEDDVVDLYVVSENVNGASMLEPSENNMLNYVGNGIYEWVGTSLGNTFRITDAKGSPRYTFGFKYEIWPDNLYNFNAGKGNNWFNVGNDKEFVKEPALSLDIYSWTMILYSGSAGVDNIDLDDDEDVIYYDLNGVQVSNPEKGKIYIRVAGGKAVKIVR